VFGFFQVKYLCLILANLGIMLRSLEEPFAGRMHGAKRYRPLRPSFSLKESLGYIVAFFIPTMRLFDIRFHSQGMLEQIA